MRLLFSLSDGGHELVKNWRSEELGEGRVSAVVLCCEWSFRFLFFLFRGRDFTHMRPGDVSFMGRGLIGFGSAETKLLSGKGLRVA